LTAAVFLEALVFGAALTFDLELGFDLAAVRGLACRRAAFRGAAFLAVFLALLPTGFLAAFFAIFLAAPRAVLRAGRLRFAGFLAAGVIVV
jgi:hypothetical protein